MSTPASDYIKYFQISKDEFIRHLQMTQMFMAVTPKVDEMLMNEGLKHFLYSLYGLHVYIGFLSVKFSHNNYVVTLCFI